MDLTGQDIINALDDTWDRAAKLADPKDDWDILRGIFKFLPHAGNETESFSCVIKPIPEKSPEADGEEVQADVPAENARNEVVRLSFQNAKGKKEFPPIFLYGVNDNGARPTVYFADWDEIEALGEDSVHGAIEYQKTIAGMVQEVQVWAIGQNPDLFKDKSRTGPILVATLTKD